MKKTFKVITLTAVTAVALTFAGQSFAASSTFTDLDKIAAKDKIISLQQSGLVKGISATKFAPNATITSAQGVQFIVNALGLNLDLVRFVKEPKATDYFAKAKNEAWYANALITAAVNGLHLPANLDPNKSMTREEFTYQLIDAIEVSGKLPMIKPVVVTIKDQDKIKADYSGSIQRAINYGVIKLDKNGKFNPKNSITRAEVAEEIYNAIEYIKAHPAPAAEDNTSSSLSSADAVKMIAEVVGSDANLQIKIDPNATMNRESFISLLMNTLQTSGKLPMINLIPVEIKDETQIDVLNSGSIQRALSLGFVKLNADGTFNPKGEISRTDAAQVIKSAAEYLKAHPAPGASTDALTQADGVKLIADALGTDVNLQIKVDPNAKMTRESFTSLLMNTLQTSGKLPMIKIAPVEIKDEAQIDVLNSGSIQRAVSMGVIKLDAEGKFNPKGEISHTDAAQAITNALEALKKFPASN